VVAIVRDSFYKQGVLASLRVMDHERSGEVISTLHYEQIDSLKICGEVGKILLSEEGIQMRVRDFETIEGNKSLGDVIINAYLHLICEHYSITSGTKIARIESFVARRIVDSHYDPCIAKAPISRRSLFEYDLVLVPIEKCLNWCLVVVDIRDKILFLYDCNHVKRSYYLDAILDHMDACHRYHYGQPLKKDEWIGLVKTRAGRTKHYKNEIDSGVFVCAYAEHISADCKLKFFHEFTRHYREKIFVSLFNKSIWMPKSSEFVSS